MNDNARIIVIGASTGGLEALKVVLGSLPKHFPGIVVVCQHIEKTARLDYQMIFSEVTHFKLVEVEDKQRLETGHIFFAPAGYHLYLEANDHFALSVDAPVNWSRPSIDVLFESAAKSYKSRVIGVILTGANGDGMQGIVEIKRLGGTTIAQNPKTALVDTMPRLAIESGCVDAVLDLKDIAPYLNRLVYASVSWAQGELR